MKNWKRSAPMLAVLVLMLTAHAAYGQSPQPPKNSAENSASSDTDANKTVPSSESGVPSSNPDETSTGNAELRTRNLINACAAAAEDLKATRLLVEALEIENRLLKTRLETEKRASVILLELNETRKAESDALRATVAAKNETISAKDNETAARNELIDALKRKKSSPWKRLGDVLLGIGLISILR